MSAYTDYRVVVRHEVFYTTQAENAEQARRIILEAIHEGRADGFEDGRTKTVEAEAKP